MEQTLIKKAIEWWADIPEIDCVPLRMQYFGHNNMLADDEIATIYLKEHPQESPTTEIKIGFGECNKYESLEVHGTVAITPFNYQPNSTLEVPTPIQENSLDNTSIVVPELKNVFQSWYNSDIPPFEINTEAISTKQVQTLLESNAAMLDILNRILRIEDAAFKLPGFDVKKLKEAITTAIQVGK